VLARFEEIEEGGRREEREKGWMLTIFVVE
jgi:hypothetical protein